MATMLLLTACEDEDGATPGMSNSPAASEPAAEGGSGGRDGADSAGADSGGKTTGSWVGAVSYMAPGTYTLTHTFDGPDRSFFTAEDTHINGAGIICGDAEGRAATPCSEDELEAAAKKGDVIVVDIKDGIAVGIDENHN